MIYHLFEQLVRKLYPPQLIYLLNALLPQVIQFSLTRFSLILSLSLLIDVRRDVKKFHFLLIVNYYLYENEFFFII